MIPIRDENPTIHPPILTVTFIVINVLVYWWQVSPKDEVVETILGMLP